MAVKHLKSADFTAEVEAASLAVVDFWADWCGPCNQLTPIIEELAAAHPELKVAKVHVDQQRELAKQHKVFSIPTLVIYKNGEIAGRHTGVLPLEEIAALV